MAIPNMLIETSSIGNIHTLIHGSYTGDGLLADELTQIPFYGFSFRGSF